MEVESGRHQSQAMHMLLHQMHWSYSTLSGTTTGTSPSLTPSQYWTAAAVSKWCVCARSYANL